MQQSLATRPNNYDPKKDETVTPLEARKIFCHLKSKCWTSEMSKQGNNQARDVVRYGYNSTFMNCDKLTYV